MKYDLSDMKVVIEGECYIAETAAVIGAVRLGNNASVWWGAVVRADEGTIVIGENSNVQDGAILHCEAGFNLAIGRGVTVAHRAVLHGCTVGDNSLIGIGAVVLNGAVIGSNCFVAAGALVLENARIPDNSLVLGSPAKVAQQVTPEQTAEILHAAEHYVKNFKMYKKLLKKPRD